MGKGLLCTFLFLLGINLIATGQPNPLPGAKKPARIHADLIVLKLKPESGSSGRIAASAGERLNELKNLINYEEYYQVFARQSSSNARSAGSRLKNIYKLRLKPGTNIWKALSRINALSYIEYAEPFFQNDLLLIPNDPQADPDDGLQDYLTVIKAYDGWQIDQSDSSMVVGIIDTGVNMAHEDLGNFAINHADPVNGIDDDGDGYVDNYNGWDIANDDNDPNTDGHAHGTHVTGISSATVNNSIGMAGIGFNSKYLPVNAWNSTYGILLNEYEGIVYAADHGANVINLSWGGVNNYSQYGQDIINYAVLEKNVVVVAAAGNTHASLDFYPASYDNVLSVGATDMEDNMATWATYSYFIDIMAPGQKIYSTKSNGGYEKSGGSSFAAPMVAGAAALVRSHFPEFSARQVMEQLRVTSDDIYDVGSNMNFAGQMGKGRLNVHRALTHIITPSIRMDDLNYAGNHGQLVFPGDSIELTFKLTNFLRVAENVTVTLSNPSANVSWEVDQIYIEKLSENQSYENTDDPISLVVNDNVEPGERLLFRIDFEGNSYSDFQYFQIRTTPEYFDISDDNLTVTVASDGDIGYDDAYYENGSGISYQDNHVSSNSGLIISTDSIHVLDNVINDFQNYTRDEDFVAETNARLFDNSIANYDARSVFRPNDTLSAALDIKIEQKALAWENSTNDGYIIYDYRIINTGDSTLNNLNLGLYADWDIGDFQANEAAWDATGNFGYIFNKSDQDLFLGLALITDQEYAHYAMDLDNLNGNSADFDTIFNDRLKHEFISRSDKVAAGALGLGNDVAHVVGARNMMIPANESERVAIVLLSSKSLEGLRSALDAARNNYQAYRENPPLYATFYACDGDSALVDPIGEIFEFYEDFESTQRIDSGLTFNTKPVFTDQEYFLVNLDSGYSSETMKILVKPGNPTADFYIGSDTLLIESGQSETLLIENQSLLGDSWQWDFGNGYSSIVEHPFAQYDTPGQFDLELIASNDYGCSDTTVRELLVAIRLDRPIADNQEICKGTSTTIVAFNTDVLEVYSDSELTNQIYTGGEFATNGIFQDTIFYLVNAESEFESLATTVHIEVKHPGMGFDYRIDTMNLDEKYELFVYNNAGPVDEIEWHKDGAYLGEGEDVTLAYTNHPFEVAQIKMDTEGCSDTLRTLITPKYSPEPMVEDVVLCEGSNYIIRPQNGSLYYFYDDMQLTNLLHKGSSIEIQELSEDRVYYVTCVDSLLESVSSSLALTLDPVQAVIEVSADTINFIQDNQIELSNQSTNSSTSYWVLTNGTLDQTPIFTDFYDQPGSYEYTLVAEGFANCSDTAYQTVHVIQVTGFDGDLATAVSMYPNPVIDYLNINLKEKLQNKQELELIDIAGNRIKTIDLPINVVTYQLNLTDLKQGIYFIRSIDTGDPVIFKLLKE